MVPQIDDPNAVPLRTVVIGCAKASVVASALAKAGRQADAKTLAKIIQGVSAGILVPKELFDGVYAAMSIAMANHIDVDQEKVRRVEHAATVYMNAIEAWTDSIFGTIRRKVHDERDAKKRLT
jgi:hypothetical protein